MMQLPCHHMFAVRGVQKLPLYSEVGVANRWKMSYLKQVFEDKSIKLQDDSYEVSDKVFSSSVIICLGSL